MVSREGYQYLEESDDSPEGSISIPEFWSESESEDEDEGPWHTESSDPVLEPSKDEGRGSDGKPKNRWREFSTYSYPEDIIRELSTPYNNEFIYHAEADNRNSGHRNYNEQQSTSDHRNSNNEQPSTSEHHNSNNEQQSTSEHRNSDNGQQSTSYHHNSDNEQQSTSDHHNSDNEQQSTSEQHNSNEPQSSGECHNSNEQQSTGDHKSNEQESSCEHHKSNEQESSCEHHNSNEEQMDEPHANCCATFLDCYNVNSLKIRDSWFIYMFQLFVSLLSVSEIVMGIIFYGSCDPQPSPIPMMAILMGIFGLAIVYDWLAKVCRHRRGEYCWNRERNVLSLFLVIFFILLTLEVCFFHMASPKTVQAQAQAEIEVKCIKVYYDYLHYMLFAIGGCLILAASLYLPEYCNAPTYQPPVQPPANGQYQPL